MTSTEYQQLVEFLTRQLGEVDRRFTTMDQQLTELRHGMPGHFDEIYRRSIDSSRSTTRSPRRYAASRHSSPTSVEGARSSSGDLAELKQHLVALQRRIEEMEQRLGT